MLAKVLFRISLARRTSNVLLVEMARLHLQRSHKMVSLHAPFSCSDSLPAFSEDDWVTSGAHAQSVYMQTSGQMKHSLHANAHLDPMSQGDALSDVYSLPPANARATHPASSFIGNHSTEPGKILHPGRTRVLLLSGKDASHCLPILAPSVLWLAVHTPCILLHRGSAGSIRE